MLGFSSTEITRAFSGGARYKPTISAALGANSGSVLTHQLLCRARQMPSLRRTRQTASSDAPRCREREGPSQFDCPFGGGSSNVFKTRLRNSLPYFGGLPERGRSYKPLIPFVTKRSLHSITVFCDVPVSPATFCSCPPPSRLLIMRAQKVARHTET